MYVARSCDGLSLRSVMISFRYRFKKCGASRFSTPVSRHRRRRLLPSDGFPPPPTPRQPAAGEGTARGVPTHAAPRPGRFGGLVPSARRNARVVAPVPLMAFLAPPPAMASGPRAQATRGLGGCAGPCGAGGGSPRTRDGSGSSAAAHRRRIRALPAPFRSGAVGPPRPQVPPRYPDPQAPQLPPRGKPLSRLRSDPRLPTQALRSMAAAKPPAAHGSLSAHASALSSKPLSAAAGGTCSLPLGRIAAAGNLRDGPHFCHPILLCSNFTSCHCSSHLGPALQAPPHQQGHNLSLVLQAAICRAALTSDRPASDSRGEGSSGARNAISGYEGLTKGQVHRLPPTSIPRPPPPKIHVMPLRTGKILPAAPSRQPRQSQVGGCS